MKKNIGILLPVSSLPARHGIGDFGKNAYYFIDWLKKHHYRYWQVLPLNPIGPGDSPYMSTCSKAIDYRYISLDFVKEMGLLDELPSYRHHAIEVNYWRVGLFKRKYLYKAYLKYMSGNTDALKKFKTRNPWVMQYATFEVFKEMNGGRPWNEWKPEQIYYYGHHNNPPKSLIEKVDFVIFTQYIALKQWKRLLSYARSNNISIIADMPFYVGFDSIDCWLHKDLFSFDSNNQQTEVGGVPPDAFSDDGQLWGSPIYNFEKMRLDKYSLLVDRTGYLANLCDYLRIDHFRAFDTYYVIPGGMSNARIGQWKEGPRDEFFACLYEKYPNIKLIAEDLGDLFPSVLELRDRLNLPGMFVVEFNIFDERMVSNNKMIVYPGTHDNETLYGWMKNLEQWQVDYLLKKLHTTLPHLYDSLMNYIYNLPSMMTIFPLQDLLKLSNKARMNTPGTVGKPNWMWKLKDFSCLDKIKYPKK